MNQSKSCIPIGDFLNKKRTPSNYMTENDTRIKKKHIIQIIVGFVCALLAFQLLLIVVAYFRIKSADIYISTLSVKLDPVPRIELSIDSNVTSPLTLKASDIHVSVNFKPRSNGEVEKIAAQELVRIGCDEIQITSFHHVKFNSTLFLENIDLSKLTDYDLSVEKFIKINLKIYVKLFLIPIRYTLNEKIIKIPKITEEEKAKKFFKSLQEAQREFQKYYEPHDTAAFLVSGTPDPVFVKKEESKEGFVPELPMNRILQKFEFSRDKNFVFLNAHTPPIFNSKYIKNLDVSLQNLKIQLNHPVAAEINIKKLEMNTKGYEFEIEIDRVYLENRLIKIAQVAWAEEYLPIQVDYIKYGELMLYNRNNTDKRGLIKITRETSVFDSPVFQFTLRNLKLDHNTAEIDFALSANQVTAFFGSFVHFALKYTPINADLVLNNSNCTSIQILTHNPYNAIDSDGKYYNLFKIQLLFRPENLIELRKDNEFKIKLTKFTGMVDGLNAVSIIMRPSTPPILKIGNIEIVAYVAPEIQLKPSLQQLLCTHKVYNNKAANELLVILSEFENMKKTNYMRKFNLILPPLTYSLTANKIKLEQNFIKETRIHFEPADDKMSEGDLFGQLKCKTTISSQNGLITSNSFIKELLGSNIKLNLDSKINLNIKLDDSIFNETATLNPIESDLSSSLKVLPEYALDFFDKPLNNSIRLNIKSPNYKKIKEKYNIEKQFSFKNQIQIAPLSYETSFLSHFFDFNCSKTPLELIMTDKKLIVFVQEEVTLLTSLFRDTDANAKSVINKIKQKQAEQSKSLLIDNFTIDLKLWIEFLGSFDFSRYEKKKISVYPKPVDASIEIAAHLEDKAKDSFGVDMLFGLPIKMISSNVLDVLSMSKDFNAFITTGSSQVIISTFFDENKLRLIIQGSLNIAEPKIVTEVKIKKSMLHLETNINDLLKLLADKINSQSKTLKNLPESSTKTPIAALKETLDCLHVETNEIIGIPADNSVLFRFSFYLDKLLKNIGKTTGDLLTTIPFETYPNKLELNIKFKESAEIVACVENCELVGCKDLCVSFNRSIPIIYGKEDVKHELINKQTLDVIYSNNLSEIEYFLGYQFKDYITRNTFDAPIDLCFSITRKNGDQIALNEKNLENFAIEGKNSAIMHIVDKVKPMLDLDLQKPLPVKNVPVEPTAQLYLTAEAYGAVSFRLPFVLNFIKQPFTLYVLSDQIPCIHMKLFGLMKDNMLEQTQWNNTIPFNLSKLKKADEFRIGKFKLDQNKVFIKVYVNTTVLGNKPQLIFSTWLSNEMDSIVTLRKLNSYLIGSLVVKAIGKLINSIGSISLGKNTPLKITFSKANKSTWTSFTKFTTIRTQMINENVALLNQI